MYDLLIRINIMLASFLIILSITACASAMEFSYKHVEAPLVEYVRDYNYLLKYHCPKIKPSNHYSIRLENKLDEQTWVGVCTYKLNGYSIEILRAYWTHANETQRRQLVYHELSHCILNRKHELDNSAHYMYPVIEDIPYNVYVQQTIDDIEEYCKSLE
jgi:hypothetical protein